jgi:hypothetical protein
MRGIHLCILMILIPVILFSQPKSKKRGIAYGKHSIADMAAISDQVSWWYNWYHAPENAVAAVYQNYGMDFVPMTWNGSFNEAGIRAFYASHPDAKYLLGFNEPNFTTQANMKPSQAAAIWPKLEKIAKDYNLKIVSPAVNYADKPVIENGITYTDPIAYLDAFFAACPNCQVDYIAVHNYMCYTSALTSDIARYKKYKRPIWLTEFACWDQQNITLDMQKSYILGAIDFLESDTSVFRYSWFTAGKRIGEYPYLDLFKPQSGQLTDLGKLYLSFNPIHDTTSYAVIPAKLEAESYTTMSGIALEATKDISGFANVGWIDANDWLEYYIDVQTAGDYNVFFRIAANSATNLTIRENGVTLKTLQIPSSGGYQNWKTLKTSVALTAGKHKLQIYTNRGQFNLNWLEITKASEQTSVMETALDETRVYPNPVMDLLTIESKNLTPEATISVIDLSGRVLYLEKLEKGTSKFEINFSTFRSGSYIVQVKTNTDVSNHLIVK